MPPQPDPDDVTFDAFAACSEWNGKADEEGYASLCMSGLTPPGEPPGR